MELITSKEEIQKNLMTFDSYKSSKRPEHRAYYADRLRLGKIFVVGEINKTYVFCPSRFVGYKNCTAEKHSAFPYKNGSITTPKITQILGEPTENATIEKAYLKLCNEINVTPSGKTRTYWKINLSQDPKQFKPEGGESGFPDEVSELIEGASKQVFVNAYERNEKARKACIAHYGTSCTICNLNFEQFYGTIGAGFIHVHHLLPISSRREQYIIDPIKDLRPVCPNCHAMLHKSDPPFSIEELKEIISSVPEA